MYKTGFILISARFLCVFINEVMQKSEVCIIFAGRLSLFSVKDSTISSEILNCVEYYNCKYYV